MLSSVVSVSARKRGFGAGNTALGRCLPDLPICAGELGVPGGLYQVGGSAGRCCGSSCCPGEGWDGGHCRGSGSPATPGSPAGKGGDSETPVIQHHPPHQSPRLHPRAVGTHLWRRRRRDGFGRQGALQRARRNLFQQPHICPQGTLCLGGFPPTTPTKIKQGGPRAPSPLGCGAAPRAP